MLPHVVVTCSLSEDRRRVVEEALAGVAEVIYLADVEGNRVKVLSSAEAVLSLRPDSEMGDDLMRSLPGSGLLQTVSAGVDHIPFERLPQRITVAGNVGGYAEPMAEHAVAMILALMKNLRARHLAMQQGRFERSELNDRVAGQSCTIVGYGAIGQCVASLLHPMGMSINAINTSGQTQDDKVDFCGTVEDLEYALGDSNAVVLSLPLTNETTGLIGARELNWMPANAVLVNVSRGLVIVERDLYAHLVQNESFRVGIDTWWHEPFSHGSFSQEYPFLELPNVIGSPHNSGMVPEALVEGARRAAQNIRRYLEGDEISGVIDQDVYVSPLSRDAD